MCGAWTDMAVKSHQAVLNRWMVSAMVLSTFVDRKNSKIASDVTILGQWRMSTGRGAQTTRLRIRGHKKTLDTLSKLFCK